MRELQFGDVFPMVKILKKMNIKNELKSAQAAMKDADEKQFGAYMFGVLLENLDKVETELLDLMASIGETTPEEIKKMDLEQTQEFFTTLFQGKGVNFFKSALKSATKE